MSTAILQAQTGRPLAPGLAFQTVNLLLQGHTFPDQLNSLDLRVGKNLRFGSTRTNVAIDLYNLFNSNTITSINTTFGPAFRRPLTILDGRFAKIGVQVDF